MKALFRWVVCRLKCSVYGHRMQSSRIYDPAAKAVTPGYACDRCGHTQRLLCRWQEVDA